MLTIYRSRLLPGEELELEYEVDYSVSGRYKPARKNPPGKAHPAQYPEVEIHSVVRTGECSGLERKDVTEDVGEGFLEEARDKALRREEERRRLAGVPA